MDMVINDLSRHPKLKGPSHISHMAMFKIEKVDEVRVRIPDLCSD